MSRSSLPNGKTAKQPANSTLSTSHVALYLRVSTEDQAERSTIEMQREFLRTFAKLYDLTVRGEYADDGITGTLPLAQRAEGRRLLEDAGAGRFGCVVVYRVDRLGRSLTALLDAHAQLEGLGIAIRSATEPFDTRTPIGTFLFQLLGSLAELEKSTITERMMLGRDRAIRNGRWTSGVLPFGYDLNDNHELILASEVLDGLGMTEAEIARDIFVRMAGGSTTIEECRRLTAIGVPTSRRYRGGKVVTRAIGWGPSRLAKMMRNPVYVGRHVFRSRQGEITRAVPRLVDDHTWEQAQAQIERNRHLPKSGATRLYLLRGLIRCGICGATYIGATRARNADTEVSYYRCGGRMQSRFPTQRFHTGGRHIPAQWLEEFIWSYCREYIQNPGAALEGARQQLEERKGTRKGWAQEQATLQHALGEKALERDRVITLYRRVRVSIDSIEAQLEAIACEEADLRQRLAMLEAQQQTTTVFEGQYHDAHTLLTRLQTKLAEIEQNKDQVAKRQAIESLVSDILVEKSDAATGQTTIRVTYRFSPRDTQISLPM